MSLAPERLTIGITRKFTTTGTHPYDLVAWEKRDARINNWKDGTVAFEQLGVERHDDRFPFVVSFVGEFMGDAPNDSMMLVGRRHVRSNNSWMHNVEVLVKGKPRCTLQIHPSDASRIGVVDGGSAKVSSRVGSVVATVEVTSDIRPNVVSLPHGWGHDVDGVVLDVARRHAGVNSNVLTDHDQMDPLSGNAVLNAIPVTVEVAHS